MEFAIAVIRKLTERGPVRAGLPLLARCPVMQLLVLLPILMLCPHSDACWVIWHETQGSPHAATRTPRPRKPHVAAGLNTPGTPEAPTRLQSFAARTMQCDRAPFASAKRGDSILGSVESACGPLYTHNGSTARRFGLPLPIR